MQTAIDVAQEAVHKAERQVEVAERQVQVAEQQLNVAKIAFTKKWCQENPGVVESELLAYLDTPVWKDHPSKSEADFLEYLNLKLANKEQKLANKEQNLAQEKQNLANKEQNLALEKQNLILKASASSASVQGVYD